MISSALQNKKKKFIYILALRNSCFYVGSTENLKERIKAHFEGRGSAWTKRHRPIAVAEVMKCRVNEEEDMWTKHMMRQYSVDQVRGGSYSNPELTPHQLVTL